MSIPHQGHTLSRSNRVNTEAGEHGAVYQAQCSCGASFRAASDGEAMVKASAHIEAVGVLAEPVSPAPVPAAAPESTEPESKPVAKESPIPSPGFASAPRGVRSPRRTRR